MMRNKFLYTLALLFASLQTFAQNYTYDSNYRLTQVEYPNGVTVTYNYDALGNRLSKTVMGSREAYAWLSSDGKTLTFCYDGKRENRIGSTYDLSTEEYIPPGWFTDFDEESTISEVVFDSSFADARPVYTSYWFVNMVGLKEIKGLNYLNTSNVRSMYNMFRGCSGLTSLDLSNFITSNVTSMGEMFDGCSGLTSLDLSSFDTSNVIGMNFMFRGCSNLENIDVSTFDLSNAIETAYMFWKCTNLKSLDLSNFNMSKVRDTDAMLASCSSLTKLTISSSMNILNEDACRGVGSTVNPCTISYPEGFDFGVDTSGSFFLWKSGCFSFGNQKEAYAWLSSDGKTLTFCYDNERNGRDGETYLIESEYNHYTNWNPDPWNNPLEVTSVIFEPSFVNVKPRSTAYWFSNFKELTSITGLEYLNVSDVTSMRDMFEYCTQLTTLDLSSFDTSNVTDMSWMFWGCSSLESINLKDFDTSNVDNMACMFMSCASIKSLDLSHFNTSKVQYFFQMFDDCSSLGSLDVTHFDTSSAISMSTMFSGCSSLTELDVSHFDTSKVIGMDQMFWACQGLKTLDVSNFDTRSVESIRGMFNYCSSLTSLDVSNFDISNVTESDMLFRCCFSLKTLKLSSSMNNIGDDACESVGSYDSPCILIAPEGFDFGVDTSGSYFEWKSGFFKLASGLNVDVDINGDGKTTISDVTALVNIIQGKDDVAPYIYDHGTADVNHDGSINTTDVIELVNIILGKQQ